MSLTGAGADVHDRPLVSASNVWRAFPSSEESVVALADVSLEVWRGEFVCLLGPSGCGKSTLLACLAGLDEVSRGEVRYDGERVTGPLSGMGVVFQRDLLLEWRSALDNVLLQYEMRGVGTGPHRQRALDMLEMVGLTDFAGKYPWQLSGGMRQRVAISRALVHDPSILFMDEPFGALDALTREQLNLDLAELCAVGDPKTVVFVTHDIDEAVFLGDRVVVMSPRPGRVVQSFSIDLPRPREDVLRDSPEFGRHVAEVRGVLRAEGVLGR